MVIICEESSVYESGKGSLEGRDRKREREMEKKKTVSEMENEEGANADPTCL